LVNIAYTGYACVVGGLEIWPTRKFHHMSGNYQINIRTPWHYFPDAGDAFQETIQYMISQWEVSEDVWCTTAIFRTIISLSSFTGCLRSTAEFSGKLPCQGLSGSSGYPCLAGKVQTIVWVEL